MKRASASRLSVAVSCVTLLLMLVSCERRPGLHLHYPDDVELELPIVELELDVFWNYNYEAGTDYNWQDEWFYGWDEKDEEVFGEIGYTKPDVFNIRRYYTGATPYGQHQNVFSSLIHGYTYTASYDWGFWDLLAWNQISTFDGVQSLVFDEESTLDYVVASTNASMNSARYQAPRYTRAFYQPEGLFSAYVQAIEINKDYEGFNYDEERDMWVKTINVSLEPRTYIYLTQVIIHNNKGKIIGTDGNANFSGMARSVNLNTGVAGADPVTVHYNVRFKQNCRMRNELVDIAGGRLMTFGLCNTNGSRATRAADESTRHYMDVKMLFNNGTDSTFVFDVTDQVRRRFKGGVITVELDADTILVPSSSGGSGFDAVVEDFEDGGTHEFDI